MKYLFFAFAFLFLSLGATAQAPQITFINNTSYYGIVASFTEDFGSCDLESSPYYDIGSNGTPYTYNLTGIQLESVRLHDAFLSFVPLSVTLVPNWANCLSGVEEIEVYYGFFSTPIHISITGDPNHVFVMVN